MKDNIYSDLDLDLLMPDGDNLKNVFLSRMTKFYNLIKITIYSQNYGSVHFWICDLRLHQIYTTVQKWRLLAWLRSYA